ncbi:MAG: hypothetical protein FJ291_28210 [Planctomycetes bacterium]|nr:hypothetical protein [Planctomycetota bacterium]
MSLTLLHNGSAVDLAAAHCELGSLVRSLAAPDALTLRRATAFDEPGDWQAQDLFQLEVDGAVVFEGRLRSSERTGSAEREEIAYTCLGLRAEAADVPFRRTVAGTATPRVVYNCPVEEEFFEAGHAPLDGPSRTAGEIVADILDAMAEELAGVIGDGSPGSGYVQADLDALAVVPPKLVISEQNVDEALRSVLAFAPDFGYWIDPATHKARFFDFRALEAKDLPGVGGAVIRQQFAFSTDRCYSACTVVGSQELVDIAEELTPAWDTGLEADWTSEKAEEFPDTYGRVWRLFATSEPAQAGGTVVPDRFVGSGAPLITITYAEQGHTKAARTSAEVVDGTKLLIDTLGREWSAAQGKWVPAAVRARFTYAKGRVSGRWPASGHAGTAHARRGLARELVILEEDRARKVIKGTVEEVLSSTSFRVYGDLASPGELAGAAIEFNGDGLSHAIASNAAGSVTLQEAPQQPIQAGDSFVVTLQDDSLKTFEGGTLSAIEKYAKETLERMMDEYVEGEVPLAGLDWSLALGQCISFTGTSDPEYANLRAALIAVEHDLAHERTVLTLTTQRGGGPLGWTARERQHLRDLDAAEVRRQLRRLSRRILRRSGRGRAAAGDPNELDPDGPLAGDGIWIDIRYNVAYHEGPGPVDRTLGGTGRYIEWISLDLKGHLVEAGVGTFS